MCAARTVALEAQNFPILQQPPVSTTVVQWQDDSDYDTRTATAATVAAAAIAAAKVAAAAPVPRRI